MIHYAPKLTFGPHAEEHKALIFENLHKQLPEPAVYVILEAAPPKLYEIYNQPQFLNPQLQLMDREIVGFGYGERDTEECVKLLVERKLAKVM